VFVAGRCPSAMCRCATGRTYARRQHNTWGEYPIARERDSARRPRTAVPRRLGRGVAPAGFDAFASRAASTTTPGYPRQSECRAAPVLRPRDSLVAPDARLPRLPARAPPSASTGSHRRSLCPSETLEPGDWFATAADSRSAAGSAMSADRRFRTGADRSGPRREPARRAANRARNARGNRASTRGRFPQERPALHRRSDGSYTPRAATPARRLVRAKIGSAVETAR
jgi:hypothetical protein